MTINIALNSIRLPHTHTHSAHHSGLCRVRGLLQLDGVVRPCCGTRWHEEISPLPRRLLPHGPLRILQSSPTAIAQVHEARTHAILLCRGSRTLPGKHHCQCTITAATLHIRWVQLYGPCHLLQPHASVQLLFLRTWVNVKHRHWCLQPGGLQPSSHANAPHGSLPSQCQPREIVHGNGSRRASQHEHTPHSSIKCVPRPWCPRLTHPTTHHSVYHDIKHELFCWERQHARLSFGQRKSMHVHQLWLHYKLWTALREATSSCSLGPQWRSTTSWYVTGRSTRQIKACSLK